MTVTLAVAFGLAVILTPLAALVATRVGVVDRPGPLKVHERPVPYLGGVAVFVGVLAALRGGRASLLVPIGVAGLLGLADDLTDLPPRLRLAAEVGIGAGTAWVAGRHDVLHVGIGIVAVLVLVNAVNLLDGLDGLAAGVAIAAALGFFVVLDGASAMLALALFGAVVGFGVWNLPPARVYLGDAGSYVIGTALATLFIATSQRDAAVVSGGFLFVGVPVADTVVAVFRRLRAHRPLLRGDRGHVYDQLVDRGWSPILSVVACVLAQAALTGAGIGVAQLSAARAVAVAAAIVVCVGGGAILAFTSPRAWTPGEEAGDP